MILTPPQIKARLQQLGIRADKYLGQHFLVDPAVLEIIRQQLQRFLQEREADKDIVVEVGPGLGVLTEVEVQEASHVITVERDPVLARGLVDQISSPHLTVIQSDILHLLDHNPGFPLRFKFSQFSQVLRLDPALKQIDDSICIANPGRDYDWLFVANIPYAITSPLLRKLVTLDEPPRHILVLVQKEVAERITAPAGSAKRGLLTVEMELVGKSTIIQSVPQRAFWPAPEVESALLHIDLSAPPMGLTEQERKDFLRVVTAGFSAKRKTLQNSLSGGLGMSSAEVKAWLLAVGIDPQRRAETLTLEEWRALAQAKEKKKASS